MKLLQYAVFLTNRKILKEAKIENQKRKNWVNGRKVKDTTRKREREKKLKLLLKMKISNHCIEIMSQHKLCVNLSIKENNWRYSCRLLQYIFQNSKDIWSNFIVDSMFHLSLNRTNEGLKNIVIFQIQIEKKILLILLFVQITFTFSNDCTIFRLRQRCFLKPLLNPSHFFNIRVVERVRYLGCQTRWLILSHFSPYLKQKEQ